MRINLTQSHIDAFNRDGFVIVENALDEMAVAAGRDRFEPLFSGEFETGLYADKRNWHRGRDRNDLTRQICNAWKADLTIASLCSRYKKIGSTDMDESYFPVLWTRDGYRTPWLDAYVRDGRTAA